MIQCPACGASEAAEPGVLTDAPIIVCRECGETWPAMPRRKPRRFVAAQEGPASEILESERRPLVSFSSGTGQAWAAKMEGDARPVPTARHSPVAMVAAGLASILFLAAFLGGREAAVAAMPDLAGLYAAVGLPVNLDGLVIEGIEAERDNARLTVRGSIRNVSAGPQPVPALTLGFRSSAGAPAGWRGFDPPAQMIAAAEAAPFILEIEDTPRQAADIVIRFRRPAERVPDGEGSSPAL
jgi:hypothetical protein